MQFEWDKEKAASNLRKHDVSFEEAYTAFADDLSLTGEDPDHSHVERRLVTFGVHLPDGYWSYRTRNVPDIFASSVPDLRHGLKGNFMKKLEKTKDELRPEYRREDFGKMVRGKYAKQCKAASNVVVLDPEVAKAFPNGHAVNEALLGLLEIAKSAGLTPRATRTSRK